MQVVSKVSLLPPPTAVKPLKADVGREPIKQLTPPEQSDQPKGAWEKESFGFRDFLDMINPLQHLPVISTIYRKLTGDEMGDAPRIVGGAIFGTVLGSWVSGLASAVANVFVERSTGKDVGDHVMDLASSVVAPAAPARPEISVQSMQSPSAAVPAQVSQARPAAVPMADKMNSATLHQPHKAVDAGAPLPSSQLSMAVGAYRKELLVDDIKRNTEFWV